MEAPAPSRHEFLSCNQVDFAEFIREDVPTDRGGHDTGHRSSYIAPNGYYNHNAAFAANNNNPNIRRHCNSLESDGGFGSRAGNIRGYGVNLVGNNNGPGGYGNGSGNYGNGSGG